jgi:CRP/FNR family transcriptional regulator, anaerobic regulatory protein
MKDPGDLKRILGAFPIFAALPPKTREALLSNAVTKKLESKQVLVRDGGECRYLPFVVEGTLRLYKTSPAGREITLYRIQKGESCILSATCILNEGSFPAIAEAEGPTEVLLVPSQVIAEYVDDNPDWRRFLFGLYAKRLDEVLTLVDEVAFHHMDSRLAAWLVRHSAGSPGTVGATHGQIADELGTSREVVTRILADFEADGLIETSRGRVRLSRPEGLRQRSAPYADV